VLHGVDANDPAQLGAVPRLDGLGRAAKAAQMRRRDR
jgi:hypothetical protein